MWTPLQSLLIQDPSYHMWRIVHEVRAIRRVFPRAAFAAVYGVDVIKEGA